MNVIKFSEIDRWLEENENFKLVRCEVVKGIQFQIYLDDYGQSYHLAWRDPLTDEVKSWCCGTYNDYKWDMEDIAEYELGVRYDNGGH